MKKKCLKVRNDGVELVLHLRYADGLGVLLSFRAPLLACGRLVAALKKRLAARAASATSPPWWMRSSRGLSAARLESVGENESNSRDYDQVLSPSH